jgi:hypothetical protein
MTKEAQMKARSLKILPLFLIAALVAGGVLAGVPGGAEAKTKKTLYDVEILDTSTPWIPTDAEVNNESPSVGVGSLNDGEPGPAIISANEGITFQMEVTEKLKKKKIKIGKEKVVTQYYPVTLIGKTFEAPESGYQVEFGDEVYDITVRTVVKGKAKGRLYITECDIDAIDAKGKGKIKLGDGTADPVGSLVFEKVNMQVLHQTMGITVQRQKSKVTWTTATSSTVFYKSRSGLEGVGFPADDPSETGLITPLVGKPLDVLDDEGELDLEGVTSGTLVSTSVSLKQKMTAGKMSTLTGQVWVMKIAVAP